MVPVRSGNLWLHIILNSPNLTLAFVHILSAFSPHWFLWSHHLSIFYFPPPALNRLKVESPESLFCPKPSSSSHPGTQVTRVQKFRTPGRFPLILSFSTSSGQNATVCVGQLPSRNFMTFILSFRPVFKDLNLFFFRTVVGLQRNRKEGMEIFHSPHVYNLPHYQHHSPLTRMVYIYFLNRGRIYFDVKITPNPQFTLGPAFGLVHSMGLGKV